MKNSLLMLAGAAALSLASCSQEKTTEVNTVPADGMSTTTTTTTTAPMTDAQIQARAQQIADKMAANMKITDEATKTKIRTVYVNRYKRMNEVRTKYTADTTGMATAMRQALAAQDQEFKVIFVDPAQYKAYQSSRSTYDDSNYADQSSNMSSSSSSMSGDSASSGAMSASGTPSSTTTTETSTTTTTNNGANGTSRLNSNGEDVSKLKVKANGKTKVKTTDGTKIKY